MGLILWNRGTKLAGALFALVLVLYLGLANYLGNKRFFRIDITENSYYTLSDITVGELSALEDVLSIELFFSENLSPSRKVLQSRVRDIITEFERLGRGNVQVSWHDPTTKNDALRLALSLDVLPLENSNKGLKSVSRYCGFAVRFGDRSEALSDISSSLSLERDLLQAILAVQSPSKPKIGILKTDTITALHPDVLKERKMSQPMLTHNRYKPLFQILSKAYQVRYVDLTKGPMPGDITTLIVPGGADSYYTDPLLRAIDGFVAEGGNLLALMPRLDLYLTVSPAVTIRESGLLPLLNHYGVSVDKALLMDENCDYMIAEGGAQRYRYPYFPVIQDSSLNRQHPVTEKLSTVILQWPSPLTVTADSGLTIDTLLTTSARSMVKELPLALAPDQPWDKIFARAKRFKVPMHPFPVALALSGAFPRYYVDDGISQSLPGRLAVVGADIFMTEDGLGANNDLFIQNLTDWLTSEDALIEMRTKSVIDRRLKRPEEREAQLKQERNQRLFNLLLMPLLLALFGITLLLFRRKKRKAQTHDNR